MQNLYKWLADSWWARHPAFRVLLFVLGSALVLAGFVLGFVPFLPGFPLGILGLILLSLASRNVRHGLLWVIGKLPVKWQRRLHFLNDDPDAPLPSHSERGEAPLSRRPAPLADRLAPRGSDPGA